MLQTTCPECEAPNGLDPATRVSEIVICESCRSELELLSLSPPMLGLAPAIEEDWGE